MRGWTYTLRSAAFCAGFASPVACAQASTAPPPASQPASPPVQAPLSASLEPALVQPTVAAAEVPDAPASYVTTDGDALVHFIEQQVGAGNLDDGNRTTLRTPMPNGKAALSKIWFAHVNKAAFVLRRAGEARAVVLSRSDSGNLVPPISWVSLVVNVVGPPSDELKTWYQELARRVATAGRATGIVQFPNGNATAVIVAVQPVPSDDADAQLVAATRFMRAGSFSAGAWGPTVNGATNVSTKKMNGHDGVSIRDMLRSGGTSAAPSAAAPATSI